MEISGQYLFEAKPEEVWHSLLDESFLKECLPGSPEIQGDRQDGFFGNLSIQLGPLIAQCNGRIQLIPDQKKLFCSFKGKGEIADCMAFTSGHFKISPQSGLNSLISYHIQFDLTSPIRKMGNKFLIRTGKKVATDFFYKANLLIQENRPKSGNDHPEMASSKISSLLGVFSPLVTGSKLTPSSYNSRRKRSGIVFLVAGLASLFYFSTLLS